MHVQRSRRTVAEKADIGIAMGGVGMIVIIVKLVLDIMNGESHLFLNKTTR